MDILDLIDLRLSHEPSYPPSSWQWERSSDEVPQVETGSQVEDAFFLMAEAANDPTEQVGASWPEYKFRAIKDSDGTVRIYSHIATLVRRPAASEGDTDR